MKVSKRQLKRIIREEHSKLIKEGEEVYSGTGPQGAEPGLWPLADATLPKGFSDLSQGLNDAELNLSALIDDAESDGLHPDVVAKLDDLITFIIDVQRDVSKHI